MRLGLFIIVGVPLYFGWLFYHIFKGSFAGIKNDALVGAVFLLLGSGLFLLLIK